MRKVLLGLLILVFMVALIANPSKAQDNKYRIGVVFKALDSDSWLTMKKGVEAAMESHNVEATILAPDREVNVQQQVQIVEDLITQGVNALCIAPSGSQELIPTFEKAYQAGIPVLLIDTDAPWDKKACYIGTDNYQGGTVAGSFISQSLNGKGKVALITGIMGHQTHMDRVKGAEDVFAKFPDIKIVAKQPANSERALGM
ncbi:substrate-binding protein domain-containing protein, partial [Acetomicrobium thermoterrenum DSM 13490]